MEIIKIIDEHKTDIIHFHWTKDLPIIVFCKKLLSKQKPKIIQTTYDNDKI